MSSVDQRVISVLVLALWMAPNVTALGLGMHLALEHHDGSHGSHTLAIVDLARAAGHGHHHDAATVPDHDHDSIVDGSVPTLRPVTHEVAVLSTPTSHAPVLADRCLLGRSPRAGPLISLFTAHCSLLL